MAGFKARFAKSLDDIVAILNLNLRDLEKSSLGGTKTILKGSSDSAPESILIPNPVASVVNTEHDLLQGLNEGGYLHLVPALHAYVAGLQAREDAASGFAMLNASRVVPVERLPIDDILTPHLSAVNPHVQYILGSQKGVAGGVCDLDSMGVIPIERIPVGLLGGLTPKFLWNPATNSPCLANPAPATTRGWFYIASGEGTQLGIEWASGDWCISDGSTWLKLDNSDRVSSVFGRLGAVTAQAGDYAAFYAPRNTTLADSAESSTLPTTEIGTVTSKLQQIRDYLKYLLSLSLTLVQKTDLTDGGDSTLHYHASDRNRSNHTGSQAASTISDFASVTDDRINTKISDHIAQSDPHAQYRLESVDIAQSDITGLQSALNAKQNTLTIDDTPTDGSTNPVTSNGVFDALAPLREYTSKNSTDNGYYWNCIVFAIRVGSLCYDQQGGVLEFFQFGGVNAGAVAICRIAVELKNQDGALSYKVEMIEGSEASVVRYLYYTARDGYAYLHVIPIVRPHSTTKLRLVQDEGFYAINPGTSIATAYTGVVASPSATADKLATPRTIALTGGVSGSAVFDGSENISITATVTDYSHRHVVDNVDGLQGLLDSKAPTSHASTAATYGVADATHYGHAMASSATPLMNGTASPGWNNGKYEREGHVHPTDTSRLAIGSGLIAGASVVVRAYSSGNTYTSNVIYLEY